VGRREFEEEEEQMSVADLQGRIEKEPLPEGARGRNQEMQEVRPLYLSSGLRKERFIRRRSVTKASFQPNPNRKEPEKIYPIRTKKKLRKSHLEKPEYLLVSRVKQSDGAEHQDRE